MLRSVDVIRYVKPLREGGSLPAICDADDGFKYVVKFKGAGQGVKSLIAEIIGGGIAKALGLKIPELVFASLSEDFGRAEPDEEIQDLLKASEGRNLGMHFLGGSLTFDPLITEVDSRTASEIVWLDNLITNVDRTARNTNMLLWNNELWLIDHGASLYFHHAWSGWEQQAAKPFVQIKDHVLLPLATELEATDKRLSSLLNNDILSDIINDIPEEWLMVDAPFESVQAHRDAYLQYLNTRLSVSPELTKAAIHARASII